MLRSIMPEQFTVVAFKPALVLVIINVPVKGQNVVLKKRNSATSGKVIESLLVFVIVKV